jgi:hypothetical protein
MNLRRYVKKAIRKAKNWLDEGEKSPQIAPAPEPVPFDNSYPWLQTNFVELMKDPVCAHRPQYAWGMLQGAALARVLGIKRIAVFEFGVASGAGLVSMERIAEYCEQNAGIRIEVFGFDTGTGAPKPKDYRDTPYRFGEGFYPCDKEELKKRLRRATMIYGMVSATVEAFVRDNRIPVGFAAFDFALYTATRDALPLLAAPHDMLLPRTPCSFRSSFGKENCEYTGEQLAISEFNAAHPTRKLCRITGLHYYVPDNLNGQWTQAEFNLHIFDHPLYGAPGSFKQSAVIDINGREAFVDARAGINLSNARWQDRSQ